VAFSAVTGEGADGLLAAIAETVPTPPVDVHALIPWDRGDLVAMLYRDAEVLSADAEPDGTRVHARVGLRELAAIRAFTTAVVRRDGGV
jgi:GTP-binding protein HflX